jgi:hypothetical protein
LDVAFGPRPSNYLPQLSIAEKSLTGMIFGNTGMAAITDHPTAESLYDFTRGGLIRVLTDQNPIAHSLRLMDMMRQGCVSSFRQVSQQ